MAEASTAICAACGGTTDPGVCGACGCDPRLDGRYVLWRVLGRGTFGTTWLATDPAGRRVAIKELRADADAKHDELRAREVRLLRELEHPGIPAYIDDFALGHGRFATRCLVQEYVEGRTLARVAQEQRFDVEGAFQLVERVCDPLAYLHGLWPPVVHRDLKPENILVRDDGSVAIVDFGSVRDAWKGTLGGSTVTGTFGYMAPEQFAGDASPASDVFALGALVVFLLARRDPAELRDRLQRFTWREHLDVPAPWDALLTSLLATEPADRPATAAEVRAAIAGVRRGYTPLRVRRAVRRWQDVVTQHVPAVAVREGALARGGALVGGGAIVGAGLAIALGFAPAPVTALQGLASAALPGPAGRVQVFGRAWDVADAGALRLVPEAPSWGEVSRMHAEFSADLRACVPSGAVLRGQVRMDEHGAASFAPFDGPGEPCASAVASASWLPGVHGLGSLAPPMSEVIPVDVFAAARAVDGASVAVRPGWDGADGGVRLTIDSESATAWLSGPHARIELLRSGEHALATPVPPGTYDVLLGADGAPSAGAVDVPLVGSQCRVTLARDPGAVVAEVTVACTP